MEKNENVIHNFEDFDELILDVTQEELERKEEPVEEIEEETPIEVIEAEEEPEVVDESDKEAATATYNTLVAKGIIPEDKEYDGSWNKLEEYFDTLPERVAEDIISSAPDITKKVIEFAFAAGDTITKESLKKFVSTYLEDIAANETDVDVTTVEGARAFMKEQLSKSLKPVAVEAALDAMEDDESLITEAKSKLEDVKKSNNHQKLIDDKVIENQKALDRAKEKSLAIQKELTSNEYSKEALSEIVTYIKSNKVNDVLREAFNSPKAYVQLVHFITKFNAENKTFDFDSFVKEAATPAVNKIKSNILKDNFSSIPKTSAKKDVSPSKKYDSVEPIIEY